MYSGSSEDLFIVILVILILLTAVIFILSKYE